MPRSSNEISADSSRMPSASAVLWLCRKRLLSGTPAQQASALERICALYDPLCRHLACSFTRHGEFDDLLQEARLAVITAARTFRPARLAFPDWVLLLVRNALRRLSRARRKPTGLPASLHSCAAAPSELRWAIAQLREPWRTLAENVWIKGLSLNRLSNYDRTEYSLNRRRLAQARHALRALLGEEDVRLNTRCLPVKPRRRAVTPPSSPSHRERGRRSRHFLPTHR